MRIHGLGRIRSTAANEQYLFIFSSHSPLAHLTGDTSLMTDWLPAQMPASQPLVCVMFFPSATKASGGERETSICSDKLQSEAVS